MVTKQRRKPQSRTNKDGTLTDRSLIQLVKKGCLDSFEELVKRYESKVYNLAFGFTRDHQDAEEVLQDVFLTLHRKVKTFQGKSAFSSWLYRITVNAAFMKLRKRKQNHSVPVEEITSAMEVDWIEREDIKTKSGDLHAIQHELHNTLFSAINRLPNEYRAVYMLRDVDGLSNKEVSEILNLSIPAVKSRLHRSRLMLRKKLQRYYDDYISVNLVVATGPRMIGNGAI